MPAFCVGHECPKERWEHKTKGRTDSAGAFVMRITGNWPVVR
jgi:hypothetical protein